MKTIWIDILHIPQFNFYRPLIKELDERGYKVLVTVLERGRLPKITKAELADCGNTEIFVIGKHRMNRLSVLLEANVLRLCRLFFWAIGRGIDYAFSNGTHVPIIGLMLHFPTHTFEDDPQSRDHKLKGLFCRPNSLLIFRKPEGLRLHKNEDVLPVMKEWAYLCPAQFTPNPNVLNQYGVKPKEYFFLREVSVGTFNYAGQQRGAIRDIQDLIPANYKVLFSLEEKHRRSEYPEDWILLQEPLSDVHSLIFFSAGLISSGDSMAREAALLGVPAYYLGTRFDMPANKVASEVGNLQTQKTCSVEDWLSNLQSDADTLIDRQKEMRMTINEKFIDINEYRLGLVEQVKE